MASMLSHKRVEDYRPGYPRFAAIIGAHAPFHISRRFARLRSRLVLLKQDQLSSLEANLEAVDANETKAIYLGNHRRDNNPARKQILQEIDCALKEYDELIERNHRMLNHESAQPLNVASLQNWVQSTGCLSRDETAYLGAEEDLICVAAQTDTFLVRLELLLERALLSCWSGFAGCFRSPISRDPNVYIFSGAFIKRFARAAAASGVVLLLLLPVIVINSLASTLLRLVLIVLSTAMVIILLAVLTKARTGDMFVAGATYATVLVVFVAGTGQSVC
ncbi:hypothetical protein B0O99DRAFT_637335 [Bisporella sp. PMI_857]|nr:hypothetical protein B0O99DRAFT_637335 [Bisporella sp. PMI_857]